MKKLTKETIKQKLEKFSGPLFAVGGMIAGIGISIVVSSLTRKRYEMIFDNLFKDFDYSSEVHHFEKGEPVAYIEESSNHLIAEVDAENFEDFDNQMELIKIFAENTDWKPSKES